MTASGFRALMAKAKSLLSSEPEGLLAMYWAEANSFQYSMQ